MDTTIKTWNSLDISLLVAPTPPKHVACIQPRNGSSRTLGKPPILIDLDGETWYFTISKALTYFSWHLVTLSVPQRNAPKNIAEAVRSRNPWDTHGFSSWNGAAENRAACDGKGSVLGPGHPLRPKGPNVDRWFFGMTGGRWLWFQHS